MDTSVKSASHNSLFPGFLKSKKMATINKKLPTPVLTHEGAKASNINPEQQLRRSVMACLLWEDSFYEDGQSIANRIMDGISKVNPEIVAEIAIEARKKLRHVPLLIVRQMARLETHKHLVAKTLSEVIQRPDELTEFLAIYWKDCKQPLSKQVKKGLASAFGKFNEYSLAKYNRDGAVKLRDVLFLCHANPLENLNSNNTNLSHKERSYVDKKSKIKTTRNVLRHNSLYSKLINGTLEIPDTWEVALSGGANKKETFERLMRENNLGALAFIRNLRNMMQAGCDESLVRKYSQTVNIERILPFRFIAAANHVPEWEPMIEEMMLRCLQGQQKLKGKTVIVVDNSGSMSGTKVSAKSEIDRSDAACALAILVREIAENPVVIGFAETAAIIPARRGFGLRDSIKAGPKGGTYTDMALFLASKQNYDRIIVVTDEQSHTRISDPLTDKAYFINVSCERNGIGYGKWTHIDGWSESIIDFIREYESN